MKLGEDSRTADAISGIAGRIILTALTVLAAFVLVKEAFTFGRSVFHQDPVEKAPGHDVTIEIRDGMTGFEIASLLKAAHAVREDTPFGIQTVVYQLDAAPGEYTVNTSMNSGEILKAISEQSLELKNTGNSNGSEADQ